uniref:Peptidase C1A papain C-terminal domain-containing protein n=1 Tax=Strombidium rassoulzadegani TaxID=1082188 RepID=A0A7S3CIK4_9SPIT|mmetsp:Transcript_11853/g.20043  ORF Transcript_11853/g.20043 Transcript_11853/m.20043 type:complete len:208 (+) Transcript_11853:857-1480(+)
MADNVCIQEQKQIFPAKFQMNFGNRILKWLNYIPKAIKSSFISAEEEMVNANPDFPIEKVNNKQIKVSSFKLVLSYSFPSLKQALRQGPVAMSINSSHFKFQFYKKGIFSEKDCSTSTNHAVIGVGFGYDEETDQEYVIIKNSWGTGWGENGYIRVSSDQSHAKEGICGIFTFNYIPQVQEIDVSTQINKISQIKEDHKTSAAAFMA